MGSWLSREGNEARGGLMDYWRMEGSREWGSHGGQDAGEKLE